MTPAELYNAGYALPMYGLYTHTWQHHEKQITLPHGAVDLEHIDGWPCAKWETVMAIANLTMESGNA